MAADKYPVDFTEPVGQIRALIPDIEQLTDPAFPDAPAKYLFSDAHLQSLLVIARDKIYLAAALALDALASNEALVSKKIRTEDLSTDGPAVAAELRRIADSLRVAQREDDQLDEADGGFEIVDFTYYPLRYETR